MLISDLLLHPKTQQNIESFLSHPSHAALIVGPEGAGKATLVNTIAAEVLNLDKANKSSGIYKIDGLEGDGIQQVRDIRNFLRLKTTGTGNIRRVIIIERLDKLGVEAQNALLKTLEEPPADTVILLTATDLSHLLETIVSRVLTINILPIPQDNSITDNPASARAYALSGGYAGAFSALLREDTEHSIAKSVVVAKQFLSKPSFDRLCEVDGLSKDRQKTTDLLDGIERCLHAALKTSKQESVKAIVKKLSYVSACKLAIPKSVNNKLLLTSLCIHL